MATKEKRRPTTISDLRAFYPALAAELEALEGRVGERAKVTQRRRRRRR